MRLLKKQSNIKKAKFDNYFHKIKKIFKPNAAGEKLPSQAPPRLFPISLSKKLIFQIIIIFLLLLYAFNFLHWVVLLLHAKSKYMLISDILGKAIEYALNPFNSKASFKELIMLIMLAIITTILFLSKIGSLSSDTGTNSTVAYGQKGDSRFTTLKEIQDQYKKIPDKTARFAGYGGFPISHYHEHYYIDDEPVHNLIFGTSRIGKSDEIIVPMIDNISRALKQSSMIINDPKKELYTGFADLLKARGYEVYLLDFSQPMNSMSYNPLKLATEKWQEGKSSEAEQYINSISYTLFHKENAGENSWVYEGAQNAANANIIEMIRMCLNPAKFSDHKAHPEKITLYNLSQQITQLSGVKFDKCQGQESELISVLDDYFDHLPQGSFAKQQYAVLRIGAGRSTSSIYSTMLQGLSQFQSHENAALTSMNSIELRSVGFPKFIKFKLSSELAGKKIILRFRNPPRNNSKNSKIIKEFNLLVGNEGYVDYNFDAQLNSGDWVEICYSTSHNKVKHSLIQISFANATQNSHQLTTKVLFDELNIEKVKLHYSDKPIAIFLSVPDYDQSNNAIISIFIQQLYSELARQCANVVGNKTIRRVQCIFDEFGNMPKLNNMAGMMSVSAGRNILFTLALQSDKQLFEKYGHEDGAAIKDNGANQKLIKCIDVRTNEDFSKAAGQQTIEANSLGNSNSVKGKSTNYNVHAEAAPLITSSRLSQMLAGEDFNIRAVHRFDKWGNRVRPYPIFNTGKTIMPGAHSFLDINTQADPNLIKVKCLHRNLKLSSLEIDYADFLKGTASSAAVATYQNSVKSEQAEPLTLPGMATPQSIDSFENVNPSFLDTALNFAQENKRSNSNFARLVTDYRGNGIDIALANKLLSAFDEDDIAKVKICINSIKNDQVRNDLENEFKNEI